MIKYIDSEIIMQRKIEPLVFVYIMIIIVIMLSLIIFIMIYHYKTYYTIRGVIENSENNYYIRCYVPIDDLKYITNNNKVKIHNEEYNYNIVYIDSEYYTDNYNTYQVIKIELSLEDKYKFNNLTLTLDFIKEDKKIIDYIIN